MKRPTPKVEKHIKYDSDLAKRIEEQAESENKHFTEWVIEASRFRIEIIDKAKEQPQLAPQSLEQPQQYPTETLTLREANHIIRDKLIPSIGNNDHVTIGDKDSLVLVYKGLKVLLELVEINLDKRRRLEFPPIPYLSPFEQARQEGLRKAREMRDKRERVELMSALPQPIEVMKDIDIDTNLETSSNATDDTTIALSTSSTFNPHLTGAEFLVLKQQQEARNERLKELEEEIRAKAKDSVKLVDESKEIPTEDDGNIPVSPIDGNEGVYDDDSDKVPQDEF